MNENLKKHFDKERLERLAWECKQLSRQTKSAAEQFEVLGKEIAELLQRNNSFGFIADSLYRSIVDEILLNIPDEKELSGRPEGLR